MAKLKTVKKKSAKSIKKKSVKAAKKKITFGVSDYSINESGIFVPSMYVKPVPAQKLSKGLEKARKDIKTLLDSLTVTLTKQYSIKQIQFSVSFDAEGKFLGIGIGGSTSVTVIAEPKQ